MEVLTQADREALISFLKENASDSVLVTAVADTKSEREHIRNQFLSLTKYMGVRGGDVKEVLSNKPIEFNIQPLSNVEKEEESVPPPPGEPCTRIGGNTRATLLARLRNKTMPIHIGKEFYPHMRLLLDRGELTWDGTYYQAVEGVR